MYTKLEISHFRAFSSLSIAPLNRINLIAGDNNIGKTGILEAIYLAHANFEDLKNLPYLFRRQQSNVAQNSRDQTDNFWLWLFHNRILSEKWRIALKDSTGARRSLEGKLVLHDGAGELPFVEHANRSNLTLKISTDVGEGIHEAWYRLNPGFDAFRGGPTRSSIHVTAVSTKFVSPSDDAELVNTIAVRNEDEELVDYMRLIEPRLKKLKYLKLEGHKFPYVYADIGFGRGKELIPASQLGQGFARLLSLFATLMVNRTQILLVDEIENGLQHDALVPIWNALGKFARDRDIQVFATTHSYECIEAAHEAATSVPDYELGVIRLQWSRTKEVEALVLDREAIETALDSRLEVR